MSCLVTLKSKGLRLTPQRRLIIELIHDRPVFLTADDIITYVQERMPGVNKSTVYRTLELLEKSDCVYKREIDGKTVYYHSEEHHHHPLICEKCGCIVEYDKDIIVPIEQALKKKYGFAADMEHLVITGLCKDCQKTTSPR